MRVVRWDDAFVYGHVEGSDELVQLPLHEADGLDHRYLTDMMEAGTRLNGVDGFLILEPDHLVDISSVAACFESYATSPLIHLLNKIRPAQNSEAIVLGNLAGLLLDEEVHTAADQERERLYGDIVRDFFKSHAVSLLTVQLSPHFHEQGQVQQQNIRHAVRCDLPTMADSFDAREGLLEPSFFSETLGLQGRMDFLQADYRVLIEQKAGKGGFPQPDPDTPVPQMKHYIQLLLYMALLKYQLSPDWEATGGQAFLLYSKYPNALQRMTFSRELLYHALKVRNAIVALERGCACDGMNQLLTLTPEALNPHGRQGKLWLQYVRPQLEALLAPLHACSPLELSYYLRFQRFIATEHLRAKVGTGSRDNAGFAAKWRQTLDEKQAAGDIFAPLTLEHSAAGNRGRVDTVRLRTGNIEKLKSWKDETLKDTSEATNCSSPDHQEKNLSKSQSFQCFNLSNFRVGDIVVLYPYEAGTVPDVCRTVVFRCTIAEIGMEHIELVLRAAQTDASVFLRHADKPWAIEHDFLESSFTALFRGMHAFLSAPKRWRDLLLFQRPPRVDGSRSLRLDHGAFNNLALRVRQALDFFLIIGPPGTGKTSFGLMTTVREELADPTSSVLLLSYTNRAVDEICSKLTEAGIDFLRIGSRLSCAEEYRDRLLEEKVMGSQNLQQLKQAFLRACVVVGTTTALASHNAILGLRTFTLAVIDEASQILEPYLMSILMAVPKFVMIGDHKQLPAVVQQSMEESCVDDPTLRAIGLTDCRLSLFERLLKRYAADPAVTYQLTRQGRMHPDIARFPSQAFYGGRLTSAGLPHQNVALPEGEWPRVAFVDVPTLPCTLSAINLPEAQVIARLVLDLYRRHSLSPPSEGDEGLCLGIIVPYRAQISAVRQAIDTLLPQNSDTITIDTVERFQGSQRDIIIYGFTVSHPSQFDFLTQLSFEEDGHIIDRKLNVAMTRAREHLILVGNASLLRQNPLYAQLIDTIGVTPDTELHVPSEIR